MTRDRHLAHDWFPEALPENVTLGAGSWLYSSFAFRHYTSRVGVTIGARSGVYYTSFFDLGPDASIAIGEYVTVVGAVFSLDAGHVEIGDHAFLAHDVVVADGPFAVPPARAPAPSSAPVGRRAPVVTIGENAWIAAGAVLLAGARIGTSAIVGAGAVVDGEVPEGCVAVGNPYRVVPP